MNQFMSTRPWPQFGKGSSAEEQAGVTSSSSTLPKAICDVSPAKVSWSSVEKDIKEAKGAQERLGRDCQRLAAKVFEKKDHAINESLKTILTQLSQRECMLGQCIILQTVEGTGMEKTKVEKIFASLERLLKKPMRSWSPPSPFAEPGAGWTVSSLLSSYGCVVAALNAPDECDQDRKKV